MRFDHDNSPHKQSFSTQEKGSVPMKQFTTRLVCTALIQASAIAFAQGVHVGPQNTRLECAPLPELAMYQKRATLAQTMLTTREAFHRWHQEQTALRAALQWGPWHMTEPRKGDDAMPSDDLKVKGADGKPVWQPRAGWKDGKFLSPIPPTETRREATVFLLRTVTAAKPVTVMVGIGGGERIELFLNGKRLRELDTRVVNERYGCGFASDQILTDQVMVDMPLVAGVNRLMVRAEQASVGPRNQMRFWFSPSPNPVPHLWQRIRRDFPPSQHPLLELANFNWFETNGWLDSPNAAQLETEFLGNSRTGVSPVSLGTPIARTGGTPVPLLECVAAAERFVLERECTKAHEAVAELGRSFPSQYPAADFLRRLDAVKSRVELDRCRREMLVDANPLLKNKKIIFTRRYTYNSRHYYDDYYAGLREWGGNICELSLATGKTRDIVPQLNGGVFDRYDISRDGKRMVFGYRAPKPEGYRIWEQNLDGTWLRQLTFPPADEPQRIARHNKYRWEQNVADPRLYGHWTDDMHPCYLPDGRIVFVSSRSERTVLCGGHSLTCTTMYRMDPDGGNLYELSQGALTESTPTMLDDGRVLYTRWEYVYKGIAAVQSLWAMRPDGTGSEEIYGHNIDNPGVFFAGRQIPGKPDHIVAVGCGHEPLAVGSIVLVDRTKDRRTKEAMKSLTPEVETRGLRGFYQFRNGKWSDHDVYGPFYTDPYPLNENFFLVSHNPSGRYNDPNGYGIYLLDTFGNRVLIHRVAEMSCFQPMVLAPRPTEPVLPTMSVETPPGEGEATVVLVDVYRSFTNVPPGTIKYLRVMEQIPRSWSASQIQPGDAVRGQQPAISLQTHIWVAVLLGIVPVEEDGSTFFKVPARRNIYFQALDENFMEIQKMRTFVNFQHGEKRSCVGCHDPRDGTPMLQRPLAMSKPAVAIAPQPGDKGPRPIHYPTDVQPIFDKHCVRCHSGEKPKAGLDLSGTLTTHFNRSYENLLCKGLVPFIQEWAGPEPDKGGPLHVANGAMMHSEAVPPYTYGSHKSRLIEVVRKTHNDIKLSTEEFVRLVTWVDANAPFYGSYFGRRNIAAKGRPDFRPVPTLESARGIEPPPFTLPVLPSELIASWKQGDLPERFDGKTFFQGKSAGTEPAISVALWVRADELKNRWNPLLFTDGSGLSAFHFSLLSDGSPNVAINYGGKLWLHNRADTAVAPGAWHHVVVTCDPRTGGVIRFYVDGKPAGTKPLDLGVPLDLTSFRLGAWKTWENKPVNNFHGALDDVRVYRGTLTDAEVATLFQDGIRRIVAHKRKP